MIEKIPFSEEKNGYAKEQVDNYIEKLSEAYQNMYNEYQAISGKYISLSEDNRTLEVQKQTKLNSAVIVSAMMNTEILAQKIIADAQAEAISIRSSAMDIVENVSRETDKAKTAVKRLLYEAVAESDKAKLTAAEILNNANNEAEAIKTEAIKQLEKANAWAETVEDDNKEVAETVAADAAAEATRAEKMLQFRPNRDNLEFP